MCDYSLHALATRPAEVAETLVSTKFHGSVTRGFASPNDQQVAVCLRPGTEIAFEKDAQTEGMMFRKHVGDRMARFRQIDTEKSQVHHDALEFSNGTIVLVTDLVPGRWLRFCNCLRAQSRKGLRLPNRRPGMRPRRPDGTKRPRSDPGPYVI
jgi:hypothetical protein